MLFVTMTSNCCGLRDDLHGTVVDVHVGEFHVRKLLGNLNYGLAPQLRALEHIRLIHRTNGFAPMHAQG